MSKIKEELIGYETEEENHLDAYVTSYVCPPDDYEEEEDVVSGIHKRETWQERP